jgi:hypothetical protein
MTIQEDWDAVFSKFGRSCPARRADESSIDFQRRLSIIGKRYLPNDEPVRKVVFKRLPDSVVPKFSSMVMEAVERNLHRTDNMEPGELRPLLHTDAGGTRTTQFVGPDSFVKAMTQPCRRVVRINAPQPQVLYDNSARARVGMRGIW